MVTQAQSAYNAKTAAARVAARLNLDPANLSYEQRAAYNKALAEEMLKYPQSFTAEALESARIIAGKTYEQLQDPSFSLGAFGDAFLEEAKVTLPSVGNKLLIGAVIVAIAYFGFKAWASKGAPSPVA